MVGATIEGVEVKPPDAACSFLFSSIAAFPNEKVLVPKADTRGPSSINESLVDLTYQAQSKRAHIRTLEIDGQYRCTHKNHIFMELNEYMYPCIWFNSGVVLLSSYYHRSSLVIPNLPIDSSNIHEYKQHLQEFYNNIKWMSPILGDQGVLNSWRWHNKVPLINLDYRYVRAYVWMYEFMYVRACMCRSICAVPIYALENINY